MGLWQFIFNRRQWEYLHSNCSAKTADEWNAEGYASFPIGIFYTTIGIICFVIYIPFLIVMKRHEFMQHSCYRFMYLIGIIDMIVLPFNSIIGGIQCALGIHFCVAPKFFYVVGCMGLAGWYGTGMTCIILGMNRFLEMVFPNIAKMVFGGRRTTIWLMVPVIYVLYGFTQPAILYNIKHFAYFFDPFMGTKGFEGMPQITFHCIHNISVTVLLGTIYASLCFILLIKSKIMKNITITKLQKIMTLQSLCICVEIWIAAIVYVYMQFASLSDVVIIIAHTCWILTHGDTPIVYLLLNKSLRGAVFKLVKDFFVISYPVANSPNLITTTIYSTRSSCQVAPQITLTMASEAWYVYNRSQAYVKPERPNKKARTRLGM